MSSHITSPRPARARVLVACLLAVACLGAYAPGATGAPKMVRLGTDPELDAPPSQDLTYLDVGVSGKTLELRIGLSGILPVVRGIDPAGVQWAFDVRGSTYIAEAYAATGEPGFLLFRVNGERFEQVATLEGTYDPEDGFARILVPLKLIGAKPGTRISGTGPPGTEDVDVHLHLGPRTEYADKMATTKDFVVPKR